MAFCYAYLRKDMLVAVILNEDVVISAFYTELKTAERQDVVISALYRVKNT